MTIYRDIFKFKNLISIIISILVAIILTVTVVFSIRNLIIVICSTFLSFFISALLEVNLKKIAGLEDRLQTSLYRITHILPPKILAKEKDGEKSIEQAFEELVTLKDKRALAFDFAIDSFQKILSKGFIIFEDNVNKYVDFLIKGIYSSKNYILATCVVRPFWFLVEPERNGSGHITKIGFEHRGSHLKIFRDEATKAKKIRIVILDQREIICILNDALKNLSIASTKIPLNPHVSDIPEIEWFVKDVNNHPDGIKLFWAIKPSNGLLKDIGDRMIFDGEVSLQFNFINEATAIGHTILSWKSIIDTNILDETNKFMNNINNFRKNTNYDCFRQLIFKSFFDLLKFIETQNTFQKEQILNDVSKSLLNQFNSHNISEIYEKIVEQLNSGFFTFPDSINISFFDTESDAPIYRNCPWRNNWINLSQNKQN